MTPAERARMIDKQEFEAECRAVRERVFARLGIKHHEDRAHVKRAMLKPVQPGQFKHPIAARPAATTPIYRLKPIHRPKRIGTPHTIAGLSLTRRQWADELGITYNAMNQAVHRLGSVEAVVRRRLSGASTDTPKQRRAGVVSNFARFEGTGAGSTAQEIPEITFSEEAENA